MAIGEENSDKDKFELGYTSGKQASYHGSLTKELPSVLGNAENWDAWRHMRIYDHLLPILQQDPYASWLTVGDSGADAAILRRRSQGEIIASSLTRKQMDYVAKTGALSGVEIREINAEQIDLATDSVDYVYCKEAYHHFPRPAVALYEMLRVARKAIILSEPADQYPQRPLDRVRHLIKYLWRNQNYLEAEFEEAGNYIYRLSHWEMLKIATALGLNAVHVKKFNNIYFPGMSARPQTDLFAAVVHKGGIMTQNLLCYIRLINWGMVTTIIWMVPPQDSLNEPLSAAGFIKYGVPKCPYPADAHGST